MKKILSLVLVLSMVLGSIGFAFAAPADVEGTDYEEAVTRLTALEILAGYPDGTFKPGNTITRAEFAKIMVTALGVGEAAKYAGGQTVFTDVAANHWAAGYINVASDMKIINGYGDGNFGPEDKVTYAQSVTMIVRALGYEPKAQAMGGYPGGYLAVGAEKEITEDVNVVNTLAATRGDVAVMVDASLTVPMMVQKTWGQYPEYEEDEDKTLMTTKLGVDEVEAVVTEVPNTDSSLDADEIKLGNDTYTLKTDVNVDALLGLEVTAWADGDDVFFVEVETDSDDIIFDTVKAVDKDDVTLYVEDDTFEWASDAKAYVNFEEVDVDEVDVDAYGYAVLNDNDEVAYINTFDFNEVAVGVVYEVEEDLYKYVDSTDASTDEIELSDYEDGVFIYNDKMELVDADEIDVNSAIFAWETSDELYLIVKNEVAQGELERIKDKEIRVDGTNYDSAVNGASYSDDKFDEFALYNEVADLDNLAGEKVNVVLDLKGETLLVYGDAETTSGTMYGVVTYGETTSKSEATVFTQEGEEVDYTFETRADGADLDGLGYFELLDSDNGNTELSFAIMEFKLNSDGEIADGESTIDTITYTGDTVPAGSGDLTKGADKDYVEVDGTKYYISEDTVFMTVVNSDGELAPDVVDYEDIYKSSIAANEVHVYGTANRDADMIVFLDPTFVGADDDYYYGVVTDGPWKAGDDYVATIDVFDESEEEYVVKTSGDFTEGEVVKFHFNSDDEIVRDAVGTEDADGTFDYDDGYLTSTDDGTVKISSDAVVYELDSEGEVDGTVSISKVDDSRFETFVYILDEADIVVAGTVVEKAQGSTGDQTVDTDGEVTYINDDNIAVDNIVYTFDSSSVLYNAAGTVAATGGTAINVLLDNGDVLEDVVVKDGVVKSLKFTRDISAEADAVDALIAAFTLTGTEAQVTEAREAYDALTDEGKALVNEAGTDVDDIILGEDTLAAAAFDALVDDFATPDATQAEVTAARNAYDALSAQGKTLVTKLATLQTEEAKLAADAVEAEIDALPAEAEITLADKDDIEAARASYNDLTAVEAAQVANVATLTTAEGAIADLETAQGDVDTALDSLDVAAIFTAPDQIELPADTLTETYAIEFSALPDDVTDGSIAGAGTAGSAATVNKDSAVDYTFDVTVTITAVDDAAGATAVDETTVTATKVFTVTVPYTVAPITVEAQ